MGADRALTRAPVDGPRRCRGCAYDLARLPQAACPECGRAFDPGDPTTFLTRPYSGLPLLLVAIGGLSVGAIPLVTVALLEGLDLPTPMPLGIVLMVLMVGGLAVAGTVIDRSLRVVRGKHPWVVRPRCAVGALAISGAQLGVLLLGLVM